MSYKKRHPRLDMGLDLTISLVLFLILIISNFAGSRLSGSSLSRIIQSDHDTMTYCCNYPLAPGSSSTGMESDGIPIPEQPAFISVPCIINPDNSGKRTIESRCYRHDSLKGKIKPNNKCCLATSTSKISSDLSQQFTLVGAKPSGTS